MRYGAHLPLIDLDGTGWRPDALASYAAAARRFGYAAVTANDHLVFPRPWMDAVVALAGVVEASGDLHLATTIALPVVRGPAALAKAAAALDIVSGRRLVLGVGAGSSPRDYDAVGVPFDERWPRFEESVRVLRAYLTPDAPPFHGRFYSTVDGMRPYPGGRDGPPIWLASWGSPAGLRRVARLGDGWIASAYNTTPDRVALARETLAAELARTGRTVDRFPCSLATMWTYVTGDPDEREAHLRVLGAMLNRPVDALAGRLLVGSAEQCASLVRSYAAAGVDRLFIWPLADAEGQLERFMAEVVPLVRQPPAGQRTGEDSTPA
jgi:alkanesulfonate monooxygenase SsuD/methylene tetrahydromethanopterin reductase-like flavin-dependent oxidoreductase (luciferase family)